MDEIKHLDDLTAYKSSRIKLRAGDAWQIGQSLAFVDNNNDLVIIRKRHLVVKRVKLHQNEEFRRLMLFD